MAATRTFEMLTGTKILSISNRSICSAHSSHHTVRFSTKKAITSITSSSSTHLPGPSAHIGKVVALLRDFCVEERVEKVAALW